MIQSTSPLWLPRQTRSAAQLDGLQEGLGTIKCRSSVAPMVIPAGKPTAMNGENRRKQKCPIHITREKCEAQKSYPWKHQPVHTPRPCSDHGRRSSRVSIALRSKYCPRYSLKRALLNRCYLLRAAPLTRAALISECIVVSRETARQKPPCSGVALAGVGCGTVI